MLKLSLRNSKMQYSLTAKQMPLFYMLKPMLKVLYLIKIFQIIQKQNRITSWMPLLATEYFNVLMRNRMTFDNIYLACPAALSPNWLWKFNPWNVNG